MISQLKREALDALKGKWGLAVGKKQMSHLQ